MKQMCNTKLSITPSKESNNYIHRNLKSERLVFFFSFVDFIGLVSALWIAGWPAIAPLCRSVKLETGEERDGNAAIVSVYYHFLLLVSQPYSQPEIMQPAAFLPRLSSVPPREAIY